MSDRRPAPVGAAARSVRGTAVVRDDRRELTVGSGVHGVLVIVAATAVLAVVGGLLALVMATFVAPG